MHIRPLHADDAAAYQALRLRGLREAPAAFGSTFEEEQHRTTDEVAERLVESTVIPRRVALGAFDGERLVGVVACVQQANLKTRHKASIFAMYVAPEARGRGVGRALIEQAIERARAWDGVDRLTLTVTTSQTAARELYEAVGFTTFGSEPDGLRQDGVSTTMDYMTLTLR